MFDHDDFDKEFDKNMAATSKVVRFVVVIGVILVSITVGFLIWLGYTAAHHYWG